jgi:hypothetical protein
MQKHCRLASAHAENGAATRPFVEIKEFVRRFIGEQDACRIPAQPYHDTELRRHISYDIREILFNNHFVLCLNK